MDDGEELTSASANGDEKHVQSLLAQGINPNQYSSQGFLPLGIAAFWGYRNIVRLLLNHGADINASHKGTKWTPLHCAAFQGHGKVVMTIMEYNPDLRLIDSKGRTASDFASAIENIWPFFAVAGCKRTPKSELIEKDVVKKVSSKEVTQIPQSERTYFSRPGSAYVVKTQSLHGSARTEIPASIQEQKEDIAFSNGDVLTEGDSPVRKDRRDSPSFNVWRN